MKEKITQFTSVLSNFRKSIVYWANDKVRDTYKERKEYHEKTTAYQICNVRIAWYKVLAVLPDPNGRINAHYICDLFDKKNERDSRKYNPRIIRKEDNYKPIKFRIK